MRRRFSSDSRRVHGIRLAIHDIVVDAVLEITGGGGNVAPVIAKQPFRVRFVIREEDLRHALAVQPALLVIIVFQRDDACLG